MYDDFKVRWLEESDYEELCRWWKAFRFPAPLQSMLPDNGRSGVMVSKGDVNVCAGFLYYTNSAFALCEYVVSNFDYKEPDRKEALRVLFDTIEALAQMEDVKLLFSTVRNRPLINKMEEFGWSKGSETTEMIKAI